MRQQGTSIFDRCLLSHSVPWSTQRWFAGRLSEYPHNVRAAVNRLAQRYRPPSIKPRQCLRAPIPRATMCWRITVQMCSL